MNKSILYRLKNLNSHNTITVSKDQFKIGRAATNDLSIENNRYVSSLHCTLEYNDGHLYIRDTSSNGTLINRSNKLSKNDPPMELHSDDIIHVVYRKDEPESNVVFQIEIPFENKNETFSTDELSLYDEDTQMVSYPSIPSYSPNGDIEENTDLPLITTISKDVEPKPIATKEEPKKEFHMEPGDDMEDVLTCVCCQDIMTNPITLEPCLHAFCNDCYTSWEAVQRTCPKCRVKVIGKKKNVVINGILEAFLKAYPQKRPAPKESSEEERNSNDAQFTKYQVGPDGMYVDNSPVNSNSSVSDDEMESDDYGNDDNNAQLFFNHAFGNAFAPVNVRFVCRQCPGAGTAATTDFQCERNQNHLLCQCCVNPMPDRRDEPGIHQSCRICKQFFCNIYFQQCPKAGCLGCLNQLRDFNFATHHLANLVNNSPVETKIVQDYLAANNKTMHDLLIECCDRLDRKEFTCHALNRYDIVPSSSVVCYKCGLRLFKDLAFQFRVHMKPVDIFPVTMRNRDNCYYGRNCHTQYTKTTHAEKFNHACEQSKF